MKMDSMPVMVGQNKLNVPRVILDPCGFSARDTADLYAREGALVVLKHQMTAMELITAMDQLHQLILGLAGRMAEFCGYCDHCGGKNETCPFGNAAENRVVIPTDLLKEAGIPEGVKLAGYPNEEDGTVTVTEADYEHDLTDVPEDILDMLVDAGICIGELDEMLMLESDVYGGAR